MAVYGRKSSFRRKFALRICSVLYGCDTWSKRKPSARKKGKDDTISIGTWIDSDGAVVFDIAEIFTDSEHDDGTLASVRAMDRCVQRDEDAMYDLANHKEVPNPAKTKKA